MTLIMSRFIKMKSTSSRLLSFPRQALGWDSHPISMTRMHQAASMVEDNNSNGREKTAELLSRTLKTPSSSTTHPEAWVCSERNGIATLKPWEESMSGSLHV